MKKPEESRFLLNDAFSTLFVSTSYRAIASQTPEKGGGYILLALRNKPYLTQSTFFKTITPKKAKNNSL